MNNDLIWTKHALQRAKERGIKQSDAWATWRHPDQSRAAQAKGNWIYYKTFGNQRIEVVVSKNQRGENIVISVWSKPVYVQKRKSFFSQILKFLGL